jgi:hypothetical protein
MLENHLVTRSTERMNKFGKGSDFYKYGKWAIFLINELINELIMLQRFTFKTLSWSCFQNVSEGTRNEAWYIHTHS